MDRRPVPSRRGRIALALLAMLVAAAVTPLAGAGPDDIADCRRRIDRGEATLAEIEACKAPVRARQAELTARERGLARSVAELDAEVVRAEAQVAALDARLGRLGRRILDAKDELTKKQVRLNDLTDQLLGVQADLVDQTNLFVARAVSAYKAGPSAYLDGLLSADSFADLIDRYEYFGTVLDADSRLVFEIESLRDRTDGKRALVEEEKNAIALRKLALEEDRNEVAAIRLTKARIRDERRAARAAKSDLLKRVRGDKAQLARLEREWDQASDRIKAILAAGSNGPLPVGGGQLLWPAAGNLTSSFGLRKHPIFGDTRMHTGIDIGAPYGAPVISSASGTVLHAGVLGGYGNSVLVDHGGGLATTYNHLSGISVTEGQTLKRGQVLGAVGCTGFCTGPHLHFEVRVNGSPVDPMPYLQ